MCGSSHPHNPHKRTHKKHPLTHTHTLILIHSQRNSERKCSIVLLTMLPTPTRATQSYTPHTPIPQPQWYVPKHPMTNSKTTKTHVRTTCIQTHTRIRTLTKTLKHSVHVELIALCTPTRPMQTHAPHAPIPCCQWYVCKRHCVQGTVRTQYCWSHPVCSEACVCACVCVCVCLCVCVCVCVCVCEQ